MGQFGPCPLGLEDWDWTQFTVCWRLSPSPSLPTASIHIPSPFSQGREAVASLSGQWGLVISLLPVLASAPFQLRGLEQVP